MAVTERASSFAEDDSDEDESESKQSKRAEKSDDRRKRAEKVGLRLVVAESRPDRGREETGKKPEKAEAEAEPASAETGPPENMTRQEARLIQPQLVEVVRAEDANRA